MGLVVSSTGLLVDAFYRRVRLGPAVPAAGPVLVVANHTHQLVDVALALRAIRRRTVLLAKAPLFHTPVLSTFVKAAHALPVHRARDGARDDAAREETQRSLASAERALAAGGCVLLFPEGVSHDEPGVYRAHSGAARIALGAVARGARDLQIVPLGLLYRAKGRPRSEAATLVGAAVAWRDLVDAGGSERDAVDALTARIEEALRDVTLHLEEWEDLPLVQAATTLGKALASSRGAAGVDALAPPSLAADDDAQAALASLAEGIARMRAHAPAVLAAVRKRVDAHARRLRRIGVRPDESARPTAQHAVVAVGRHAAGLLVAPLVVLAGLLTGRRALVARGVGLVTNAGRFARLLAAGRFARRVDAERRALLVEIEALLRAARTLPPAPASEAS